MFWMKLFGVVTLAEIVGWWVVEFTRALLARVVIKRAQGKQLEWLDKLAELQKQYTPEGEDG